MDLPFLHYSCQQIDDDDIEAVVKILRSDWLTQGPAVEQFESALCAYTQAPYAVATSSATTGLHTSCLAMGVKPGDMVWTTPMTFLASANSALYAGAKIDFVDIDATTGNICPEALARKLETSVPKLLTVVHYTGRPCDMEAIYALKQKYGFLLMEDCAHAIGATYENGKTIGSDSRSDACVFSFHPVKPITTGEGGAIVTHNKTTATMARELRSHGVTRESARLHRKNMPAWYYEQQALGFNYRMTDMQAALGASQLHKLDIFIAKRRALAANYPTLLEGIPLRLPPASNHSGWHLYVVQLPEPASRDGVFETLREQKIGVNVHYMPVHLHPYYADLGFRPGQFPAAEAFFAPMLSLPLHPGMSARDQQRVAAALRAAL